MASKSSKRSAKVVNRAATKRVGAKLTLLTDGNPQIAGSVSQKRGYVPRASRYDTNDAHAPSMNSASASSTCASSPNTSAWRTPFSAFE